ncbi:unnamed protein product [Rhizoctonia solani]|uniref:Uncharacterized protein n=1 Tax=Rhizoctonia solani TaxID=456999 RepID=A0A8H3BS56_9AGAM|nr:unnamed protein product [Rhizoctonia solani]
MPSEVMEHRRMAPLATWKAPSRIASTACSPDGSLIAFGCLDGTVGVLDAYTGSKVVAPFQWPNGAGWSITFSSDGSRFASMGIYDGLFRVWSTADGSLVAGPLPIYPNLVRSMAFSPSGNLIAIGSYAGIIYIFNVKDGALVIGPEACSAASVDCIAFSADGAYVACASNDGTVCLWDIRKNTAIPVALPERTLTSTSLAFSPDGTRLFLSADKTLNVRNILDGSLKVLSVPSHPSYISVLPSGRHILVTLKGQSTQVWDIDDETIVAGQFVMRPEWFDSQDPALPPSGTHIIGSFEDAIHLWSLRDGAPHLPQFNHDTLGITSIVFSPSETRIYSTSGRAANIWDISQELYGVTLSLGKQHSVTSLPVSYDGAHIAMFLDDHSVEVLSTKNGNLVAGPFSGHTDSVTSAAFSQDGAYLATGSRDHTVSVWDINRGRLVVGPLVGHDDTVMLLSFSTDGSRLVSYSVEGSIRLWDLYDNIIEAEVSHHSNGDARALRGCSIRDDGWLTNGDSSLLLWMPPDFPSKPSPHTQMCITHQYGSLYLSKQRVVLGGKWHKCWTGE